MSFASQWLSGLFSPCRPWISTKKRIFYFSGRSIHFILIYPGNGYNFFSSLSYICCFFCESSHSAKKTRFLFNRIYTQTLTSNCWMIRKKANKKTTRRRCDSRIFQQALHYLASRTIKGLWRFSFFVNSPWLYSTFFVLYDGAKFRINLKILFVWVSASMATLFLRVTKRREYDFKSFVLIQIIVGTRNLQQIFFRSQEQENTQQNNEKKLR